MKLVILAGGYGSRISEESHLKPKALIEIGSKPIIWHIMKYYSCFGVREFIICCGYKGYLLKEYFSNYLLHNFDVRIDLKNNLLKIKKPPLIHTPSPWGFSLNFLTIPLDLIIEPNLPGGFTAANVAILFDFK